MGDRNWVGHGDRTCDVRVWTVRRYWCVTSVAYITSSQKAGLLRQE